MRYLILHICLLLVPGILFAQPRTAEVKVIGAMKNVMWKGELQGVITLDTIQPRESLYGFGPVEYLAGEILIVKGIGYKSSVAEDSSIRMENTAGVKAPFFAYAHIEDWNESSLPDSITDGPRLESFLLELSAGNKSPFMFRLSGRINSAGIHIVNLPKGAVVRSPDDAHRGQVNYRLKDQDVDIVGFFSTQHKAVFTHHDTFLHMHLVTADRSRMGHLDEVIFNLGSMKLYLPAGE